MGAPTPAGDSPVGKTGRSAPRVELDSAPFTPQGRSARREPLHARGVGLSHSVPDCRLGAPTHNEKVFHGYRGRDMYATNSHVHNQVYHKQASLPTCTLHRRRSVTAHVYTGNPPPPEPTRSATGRSLAIFGRPARSPGARPPHTQPVTAPPTSVGVCSHAMSRNSWKLPAAYQSRAAPLRAFYHLHAATLRVFTR